MQSVRSKLIKIAFMIVLTCNMHLYGDDVFKVIIGEEEISFVVPSDPIKLEEFYKTVISVYAESENKNLSKDEVLKKFAELTIKQNTNINTLETQVAKLQEDIDAYVASINASKIFVGPLVGYNIRLPLAHSATFGVSGLYVRKTWILGLQAPITVSFPDFSVTAGIGVSILFRIK